MRLDETSIVVTGASSGLGKAMARAFISEGADVVCSSYADTELRSVVEELESRGPGTAHAVTADVRDWADVQELVADARDRAGPIDVWVNNAGIMQFHATENREQHPVVDLPLAAWRQIIDTNLTGVFLCSKAVLPDMLDRNEGRLLHVTSSNGVEGRPNRSPYCSSKFGLEGFHECLSLELEGTGVDSIGVRPPRGGVYNETYGEFGLSPEEFEHQSPDVITESAIRLAAGEGDNGGRYVATDDGTGFRTYSRTQT